MRTYELRRIDDATLLQRLHQIVAGERTSVATLLTHLGEVEARRLHVAAGYSSMFDYCLREFLWTEQTTVKRLRAARCARQYPVILEAIADGRLNVSGVVMLRPHLEPKTATELLAQAFGKSRADLELMLAARAPKADVPTKIRAAEVSPGTVDLLGSAPCAVVTPTAAKPKEFPSAGAARAARQAHAAVTRALRRPGDRRSRDACAAPPGPGAAEPSVSVGRRRAGSASCARRAREASRAAEVRDDPAATTASRARVQDAVHPGSRATGGAGTRPGPMHVRERQRASVRIAEPARVRSRHAVRSRRHGDRRGDPFALPGPQ
jgi:hypothetical protein